MEQAVSSPEPAAPQQRTISGGALRSVLRDLLVPILAVFTAVIIGSIFILLAGLDPFRAYQGLLQGALGTDGALTRSLLKMAPLILSGLAVAFAFKGGLFNIGAQGQLVIGSLFAAWVGFSPSVGVQIAVGVLAAFGLGIIVLRLPSRQRLPGVIIGGLLLGLVEWLWTLAAPLNNVPPLVHVALALGIGAAGGAMWGFLPGLLKARTGAHEVISTIMLNYIASLFVEWVVAPGHGDVAPGPLTFCRNIGDCPSNPNRTPPILNSAFLPTLYRPGGNTPDVLHFGVLLALIVAILIWILLYKTTFGFELRMVGLNSGAARYSGVKVTRMTVLTMVIAGGLAGLAGTVQVLGVNHEFQTNQNLALGFDSIAVALLAASNPIAIIPSAFLFGVLDAGTAQMQLSSRVPGELIQVVQALILMFVAADQIIRGLYRIKAGGTGDKLKLNTSWGQR
jgi:simple sugar transport system permease protein